MIFPYPKPGKRKKSPPKDGRLVLSSTARSQQRKRLWRQRIHVCEICFRPIWEFEDMELDHIVTKGMGGGKRDDSDENQRLTHIFCNQDRGSKPVAPKENSL